MKLAPIIGAVAHFAPVGRTIETVAVTADAKPAGSVFTTWEPLSCITDNNVTVAVEGGTVIRCFNPLTGKFEKKANRGRNTDLIIELTVQEITQFIAQLAMNAASVSAEVGEVGEYVPNSQLEPVTGWLFITQYAGEDSPINALELYGELTLTNGLQGGQAPTIPQLRFEVLGNALNEGIFTNLLPA